MTAAQLQTIILDHLRTAAEDGRDQFTSAGRIAAAQGCGPKRAQEALDALVERGEVEIIPNALVYNQRGDEYELYRLRPIIGVPLVMHIHMEVE